MKTPIGDISAFDTDAIGINADENSLKFDEDGRVTALATTINGFTVRAGCGETRFFKPGKILNPVDGELMVTVPLRLEFDYENKVTIIEEASGEKSFFSFSEAFAIFNIETSGCSPSSCASCSMCSGKK